MVGIRSVFGEIKAGSVVDGCQTGGMDLREMTREQFSARISANIRARRVELGWTLRELSERTGFTLDYHSRIELDHRGVSISLWVAAKTADALNTTIDELIGRDAK
jgi:hypothetical protein